MAYEQCAEYKDAYGEAEAINMGKCPSSSTSTNDSGGSFDWGSVFNLASTLSTSGNCQSWDEQCKEKELLLAQAELERSRTPMQVAKDNTGLILGVVLVVFVIVGAVIYMKNKD